MYSFTFYCETKCLVPHKPWKKRHVNLYTVKVGVQQPRYGVTWFRYSNNVEMNPGTKSPVPERVEYHLSLLSDKLCYQIVSIFLHF